MVATTGIPFQWFWIAIDAVWVPKEMPFGAAASPVDEERRNAFRTSTEADEWRCSGVIVPVQDKQLDDILQKLSAEAATGETVVNLSLSFRRI